MAPGSPLTFSGTATDDEGLNYVEITLRNSATRENLAADGTWGTDVQAGDHRISTGLDIGGTSYNWSYTTPFNLTPGTLHVLGEGDRRPRPDDVVGQPGPPDDQRPGPRRRVPERARSRPTGTQPQVQVLHLDLAGAATDDIGVSAVRVTVEEQDSGRYLQPNGSLAAAYSPAERDAVQPERHQHQLDAVGGPAHRRATTP